MIVFKLGGSLLTSGWLLPCLDKIEQYSANRGGVIVAGGGVFADQVRRLQYDWQFDDRSAHAMAILAMQQMALLLQGLRPQFKLAERVADIPGISKTDAITLWLPALTELDADGVPASWDITSDSLSAWLANKLSADELIVLKAAVVDKSDSVEKLVSSKIVDAEFSRHIRQGRLFTRVMHASDFIDGNRENENK
jgi:aspartokinase-like uncharacterized kinase